MMTKDIEDDDFDFETNEPFIEDTLLETERKVNYIEQKIQYLDNNCCSNGWINGFPSWQETTLELKRLHHQIKREIGFLLFPDNYVVVDESNLTVDNALFLLKEYRTEIGITYGEILYDITEMKRRLGYAVRYVSDHVWKSRLFCIGHQSFTVNFEKHTMMATSPCFKWQRPKKYVEFLHDIKPFLKDEFDLYYTNGMVTTVSDGVWSRSDFYGTIEEIQFNGQFSPMNEDVMVDIHKDDKYQFFVTTTEFGNMVIYATDEP